MMASRMTRKDALLAVDCPSDEGGCGALAGSSCVTRDTGQDTPNFHAARVKEAKSQGVMPEQMFAARVREAQDQGVQGRGWASSSSQSTDVKSRRVDKVEVYALADQLLVTMRIMGDELAFARAIARILLEHGFKHPNG